MKLRNKKTSEVDDFLFEVIYDRIDLYRRVGHSETKNIWKYNSLAELNEEWEDYKPKEPLIKDEKIRDIIRLWTKVNDVVGLTYNAGENSLTDIFRNEIDFNEMLGLEDGGFYTTKELCGEEEE